MANFSLGEAVLGTAMDLAGLRKGMGQAEGESKSLWSKIGSIGEKALGVLNGNIATKGFDALLGAVQSVGDTLLNEAPRVEGLRTSFDNLAESAGFSGEAVLDSLRAAAKGMVTDVSLMESFNKSMLLVGEGMADKLPKLLEIAQASAAATGEDVGFMLDSLVTGIGRGSPMILDNLGLTINLSEAYEDYAKTLGTTAKELTKAQQQEALLNAVMASGDEFIQRLGDNTGGVAQKMAQFKTTIENLKMGLATGLLPALTAIVTPLANLAMEHLPKLIPLAERFGEVFATFVKVVLSGSNPLTSFVSMLAMLGVPPEIVSGIKAVTDWLNQLIDAVSGFVSGFLDEGLYIGIENFLGAFNIEPPAWLWDAANVVLNISNAIKEGVGTALPLLGEFFDKLAAGNDPLQAFGALLMQLGFDEDAVLVFTGALAQFSTFVTESVIPAVAQLGTWFTTNVIPAVQSLADWFQTVLLPAMQQVWEFVQNNQLPLFTAMSELLGETLKLAVTALAGIWENVLLPALKAAGKWIGDTFGPILEQFVAWLDKVTGGAEGISSAFEKVIGWVQSLTEKLRDIKLPDWMTPGSPTPWEIGLRGVADALDEVSGAQLPQLSAGLGTLPAPALAGDAASAAMGGGGVTVNLSMSGVTINDQRDLQTLAWELSAMIGAQLQARRV